MVASFSLVALKLNILQLQKSRDLSMKREHRTLLHNIPMRLRGGDMMTQTRLPNKGAAGFVERLQSLHRSIEAKRLELCPWEQFGIECEEAFAYQQVHRFSCGMTGRYEMTWFLPCQTWICPSQGWNRLQRAVDACARQSQGSAFVPNKAYWPVTLLVRQFEFAFLNFCLLLTSK